MQGRNRFWLFLVLAGTGLVLILSRFAADLPTVQVLHGFPYEQTRQLVAESPLRPLFQWDAGWYLQIAAFGYGPQDGTTAFAPLFPWLWRLLMFLMGRYPLAAALLLNAFCVWAALSGWQRVGEHLVGSEQSWRGLLLWVTFPSFFFLWMPYSEALFLALAGWAWALALERRWGWAAALAGLATLARFQGVVLAAVFFWLAAVADPSRPLGAWRQRRLSLRLRLQALAASVPLLVLIGWQAALSSLGYDRPAQALWRVWGIPSVFPWQGLAAFVRRLISTGPLLVTDWLDLAVVLLALLGALAALWRLPGHAAFYLWGTLAVIFTRGATPHLFDSFSRYALALVPLFFLAGDWPRPWRTAWMLAGGLLQVFLLLAFLLGAWVA